MCCYSVSTFSDIFFFFFVYVFCLSVCCNCLFLIFQEKTQIDWQVHGVRKRERGNKDDKEMKKEEGEKKNEKGKTKKQL